MKTYEIIMSVMVEIEEYVDFDTVIESIQSQIFSHQRVTDVDILDTMELGEPDDN